MLLSIFLKYHKKRMKLAIILFGISLEINRYWQYDTLYSVDYNNSYDKYYNEAIMYFYC